MYKRQTHAHPVAFALQHFLHKVNVADARLADFVLVKAASHHFAIVILGMVSAGTVGFTVCTVKNLLVQLGMYPFANVILCLLIRTRSPTLKFGFFSRVTRDRVFFLSLIHI